MESALPGRRPGLGNRAKHPAEAQAAPNTAAACPARDHVASNVGTKRSPGECHSDSTGPHTARHRADSLTAHHLSPLAAPCTGGHLTSPGACLCPWPCGTPQEATRSWRAGPSPSIVRTISTPGGQCHEHGKTHLATALGYE